MLYEKNKLNKISFVCFLIASICFYISALFSFMDETTISRGVANIGLGSVFLCLSIAYLNKKEDK